MLNSMTGFGSRQAEIPAFGKINIELRSTNHKFLDLALHLPEGFLSLEEKIKKRIEARVKRGRITCVINITSPQTSAVFVNEHLLKDYINALNKIKEKFNINGQLQLDTIVRLPNVLSVAESRVSQERIWPRLNLLVKQALDSLVRARQKEGRALEGYLKQGGLVLGRKLDSISSRAKKVINKKCCELSLAEERSSFLKETDITEELQRLAFHVRNFKSKLSRRGPLGKELDFIAQEMQRETNTIGAKSFDAMISGLCVELKSQIEKIREQVQNVE
ncbi:MAG: YicC/YloC family endoribonuclease [Candidatus Omnitrophota bacterium]|nr:YicC/YloC family endoribonuclease [Candidatus Omnitrophota bacterium]